jgi:hypothetical protein
MSALWISALGSVERVAAADGGRYPSFCEARPLSERPPLLSCGVRVHAHSRTTYEGKSL